MTKKDRPKHNLPSQQNRRPEPSRSPLAHEGQLVGHVAHEETFSGPLPPPQLLSEYDKILPGAADRILAMAERQQAHRQDLEKTVIKGDSKRANQGLYVGAGVALFMLGGAIFVIIKGHDIAGATIASLDVVALASVFVYGSVSRRRERVRKAELINRAKHPRSQ